MDLQIGDIQETALITLAIRASETDRPNARIKDFKAKEIIDALGVDVSKYDPFMSHEGVVARTIMYKNELEKLIKRYPDALCINLDAASTISLCRLTTGKSHGLMLTYPTSWLFVGRYTKTATDV